MEWGYGAAMLSRAEPRVRPRAPRAFDDLAEDYDFTGMRVEGRLPHELAGTLYATGPSARQQFGEAYTHWFDGDGAVSAVRLADGAAHAAVRMLDTPGLQHERRAGRMLYGGYHRSFDWPLFGRAPWKRGKNTGNTAMLAWQDRLYALWEAGHPIEVDPETLETLPTLSKGAASGPLGAVRMGFAAHPHRVPARRTTFGFGVTVGARTVIDLYALPDAGGARRIGSVPLAPVTMVHDVAVTRNHLVFLISPLRLKLFHAVFGLGGFDDNLVWEPERGTEVVVVPLDDPALQTRFRCEPFYQWHFANAYEEGDELVFDFARYPDFGTNEWLRRVYVGEPLFACWGHLCRARVRPAEESIRFETRWHHPCDFPTTDPRRAGERHRYVWCGAHRDVDATLRGLQDRTAKVDLDRGEVRLHSFGVDTHPGQPTFIPRDPHATEAAAEDEGWLLTHVYDARRHESFLAVQDAATLDELARCVFPAHLPFRLHTAWVDGQRGA